MFILYDYTTNAILVEPIKDTSEKTMIDTFKTMIAKLTKKGFKPVLNIIDNVATKAIKNFLETNNIDMQLVEPHNHRVNAAERAIQTFKNHFIAGLCTTDEKFPAQLWNKLIEQGQDSLNMLRMFRAHPHLSAYNSVEGIHDFNKEPWAPPGTRATIFNPPEIRTSWGPRALDAWYVGPAKDHYRCYNFFVTSTGGQRVSGQATFYPTHCTIPKETMLDETKRLAASLTNAIHKYMGIQKS